MPDNIKIFHMSSFSRSGETLMLRCLSAHPDIHIVHNLLAPPEPKQDLKLFHFIRCQENTTVSPEHPRVVAAGASEKKVILIKNAVWEHKFPYHGFVLARNPLSIVQSFKLQKEGGNKSSVRKEQYNRWFKGVDPRLLDCVDYRDNIVLLCALYNRKMYALSKLDLPVVRYENFVQDHEKYLRSIIASFGLEWHDDVLTSHLKYKEGDYGHGHLPLWRDVHKGSTDKYKELPKDILALVHGLTYPTLTAYGYQFDEDYNLVLSDTY